VAERRRGAACRAPCARVRAHGQAGVVRAHRAGSRALAAALVRRVRAAGRRRAGARAAEQRGRARAGAREQGVCACEQEAGWADARVRVGQVRRRPSGASARAGGEQGVEACGAERAGSGEGWRGRAARQRRREGERKRKEEKEKVKWEREKEKEGRERKKREGERFAPDPRRAVGHAQRRSRVRGRVRARPGACAGQGQTG